MHFYLFKPDNEIDTSSMTDSIEEIKKCYLEGFQFNFFTWFILLIITLKKVKYFKVVHVKMYLIYFALPAKPNKYLSQ